MAELAVRSPTNVSIDYTIAKLFDRSIAFIIDVVIINIGSQIVVSAVSGILTPIIGDDHFFQLFLQIFLPIVAFLCYFALLEYFMEGQTLGKKIMGLRTIRTDGAPPTFETYGLRASMLLLDFLICLGTIGLLAAVSSPLRQRIGDRIAQTVVIRSKPSEGYQLKEILSIKTVDNHRISYPAADTLSIDQALIIKEMIVKWEQQRGENLAKTIRLTARHVANIIGLEQVPGHPINFLRQVLRDYIVLTR